MRYKELVAGVQIRRGDKITTGKILQLDDELFKVSVVVMPKGSMVGPMGRAERGYRSGDLIYRGEYPKADLPKVALIPWSDNATPVPVAEIVKLRDLAREFSREW